MTVVDATFLSALLVQTDHTTHGQQLHHHRAPWSVALLESIVNSDVPEGPQINSGHYRVGRRPGISVFTPPTCVRVFVCPCVRVCACALCVCERLFRVSCFFPCSPSILSPPAPSARQDVTSFQLVGSWLVSGISVARIWYAECINHEDVWYQEDAPAKNTHSRTRYFGKVGQGMGVWMCPSLPVMDTQWEANTLLRFCLPAYFYHPSSPFHSIIIPVVFIPPSPSWFLTRLCPSVPGVDEVKKEVKITSWLRLRNMFRNNDCCQSKS